MIRPRPHIAEMSAYALADLSVAPDKPLVSLAQNESFLPPGAAVIAAGQAALTECALYPDPDWSDLRCAISDVHGIDRESILCGAGSMELIGALVAAYCGPDQGVLSTAHAYAYFRTAAQVVHAPYRAVPEVGFRVSPDHILSAITPGTRLVCVANPGNPTGTALDADELISLRESMPEDVLLLVDEAYAEFSPSAEPLFHLCDRGNTVVTRTFSKAYALAGQRVGWGVFPEAVAAEVRKLLNPNNVSLVSQAMAEAAMRDQAHMAGLVRETAALREALVTDLHAIGLMPVASTTNFVLIPFANPQEARSADAALRAEGLLLRGMAGYGLPDCLRVTIGPAEAMNAVVAVLRSWRG